MARLQNWEIVIGPDRKYALHGIVFDHHDKAIFDGQEITSSALVRIDFSNGNAETKNTFYYLEDPLL